MSHRVIKREISEPEVHRTRFLFIISIIIIDRPPLNHNNLFFLCSYSYQEKLTITVHHLKIDIFDFLVQTSKEKCSLVYED